MRIGGIQAAVYWGADGNYGSCEPFTLAGELVEPTHAILNDSYNPNYYTEHYNTLTEVVLSYDHFIGKTYTIDLSAQEITFHDTDNEIPTFTGQKIFLRREFMQVPTVMGQVDGNDLVLQIDLGDEVSLLHKDILSNREPVGEYALYANENDTEKTILPLYEVPVRLSREVTLLVKARPLTEHEESIFLIVGSHGCIGVDIVLHNVVTFNILEWEPRVKKHFDTLYFNPFKK